MRLEVSVKALKELDRIPEPIFSRIKEKIESLVVNPYPNGIKKLTRWSGFRLRVGDYRVLYEVIKERSIVKIYRVAHRREVYR